VNAPTDAPTAAGAAGSTAPRVGRSSAAAPLHGRVALVTGASRGIGAATAGALAGAGARVLLAARPSADLDRVAAALPGALAVPTDVRDPAAVERLVAAAADLGGPDVLVHAAGLGVFAPLQESQLAEWDETLEVNLRAAYLLCRAALPGMRARGRGHVFTIVSIAGVRAFAGAGAYCASKFGLLGFTRVLAEEVRRDGIKVTAVVPGAVDTPFWERAGGDFARERMLRPEDVASAILFAATAPPGVHHDEIHVMPPEGVL
jgi:NAD(P)-dependent dehydrogenase (short-subunit alcohol dehydrogenase family)